jgi:hypothetical protein
VDVVTGGVLASAAALALVPTFTAWSILRNSWRDLPRGSR